jgi:hypothetical protein
VSAVHDAAARRQLTRDLVIEAKDVRKLPKRPSLYVVTLSDGKPSLRTQLEERRDTNPTWGDTPRPLCVVSTSMPASFHFSLIYLAYRSAHLRSNLTFRLKRESRFLDSLLGSIDIQLDKLLDRCGHGERMSR